MISAREHPDHEDVEVAEGAPRVGTGPAGQSLRHTNRAGTALWRAARAARAHRRGNLAEILKVLKTLRVYKIISQV
jgi:hypothetical protein